MKYRGVEYTVVRGVERGIWKWTVLLGKDISKTGQAIGKPEAVAQATRVISKALVQKRQRLVPPGRSD
jgi:hypothetical protein